MYRKRFGLHSHPLPKSACGKTFYAAGPPFDRLARTFEWLAAEPGLATLTGDAGVGKTAALRHLCASLPRPESVILYVCDTHVTSSAVYRNLAHELRLKPAYRRDALWRDLKRALRALYEAERRPPILVLDEAQHLPEDFLLDLAGFLNFAFDSEDLLTVWLVGLPALDRRLALRHHAALHTRIVSFNHLPPRSDRDDFAAMIHHGLRQAGAQTQLLSDHAMELLFRASRGIPRLASRLLRASLVLAHQRDLSFVDEHVLADAIDELALNQTSSPIPHTPQTPPPKTRPQSGTRSRG